MPEYDKSLMPKIARTGLRWVTSSRDIRSIRKGGSLFRGEHVFAWISTVETGDSTIPCVGVVAGRGFSCAARRNLAKRKVHGCIMDLRHLLKAGNCYLVECRPGVEEVSYQYLVNDIQGILSRTVKCR